MILAHVHRIKFARVREYLLKAGALPICVAGLFIAGAAVRPCIRLKRDLLLRRRFR